MSKTVYENVEELAVEADTSALSRNVLTYTEQAMFLAEAAESSYNEMMKSIGIQELSVYEETGEIVVYEGASFKSIIDKVVGFLKKILSQIKGFFEETYKKFEKMYKERKEKLADAVDAKINDLGESNYKAGKIYNYAKLTSTSIDGIAKNAEDVTTKINGASADAVADIGNNIISSLLSGVVSSAPDSLGEATKKVKEELKGEKVDATVDFVKKNWAEIRNCAINGNGFKSTLKTAFKDLKKVVDKAISSAKKLKETDDPEAVKKSIQVYKDVVVAAKSLIFAAIDVAKLQDTEYTGLFVKVARAVGKGKADKAANESTEVELGTSQKDLIKEAFNW